MPPVSSDIFSVTTYLQRQGNVLVVRNNGSIFFEGGEVENTLWGNPTSNDVFFLAGLLSI
jgi:hypothetical protein